MIRASQEEPLKEHIKELLNTNQLTAVLDQGPLMGSYRAFFCAGVLAAVQNLVNILGAERVRMGC